MGKFNIDTEEWLHLGASIVTVSLAFSLFKEAVFSPDYFWLVFFTVGLGFVLHELAHKYAAVMYGATSYYRASSVGLFAALLLAFLTNGSLVFAAPGAVYFHGQLSEKQVGKIKLAGPLANLALALFFGALAIGVPGLKELALTGVYVNTFIGAFNMVPFGFLDGAKIYEWNKNAWIVVFLAFFALMFTVGV